MATHTLTPPKTLNRGYYCRTDCGAPTYCAVGFLAKRLGIANNKTLSFYGSRESESIENEVALKLGVPVAQIKLLRIANDGNPSNTLAKEGSPLFRFVEKLPNLRWKKVKA